MENNEVESLADVKLYSNSFIPAIFSSDFPSLSPTKAPAPPTRLTPQLPARSTTPIVLRKPVSAHSQRAGRQKTNVLNTEKMM